MSQNIFQDRFNYPNLRVHPDNMGKVNEWSQQNNPVPIRSNTSEKSW